MKAGWKAGAFPACSAWRTTRPCSAELAQWHVSHGHSANPRSCQNTALLVQNGWSCGRDQDLCSLCTQESPSCESCPLVNIQATRPLELVCMNFLSLEPEPHKRHSCINWPLHQVRSSSSHSFSQKAKTAAKYLWDNFIVHYGIPKSLHTDQGPDFESCLINELCEVSGIQKVWTTLYHPQGNPIGKFNQTFVNMLGTLENKHKTKWRECVKPLVHAYNCTHNEVTGLTLYELMFRCLPWLSVDLAIVLPLRDQPKFHTQYGKISSLGWKSATNLFSRMLWKHQNEIKFSLIKRWLPQIWMWGTGCWSGMYVYMANTS